MNAPNAAAPEWSNFFSATELAALELGFVLPKLEIDSPVGAWAAWAGCTIDPDRVPPITFSRDYFSSLGCSENSGSMTRRLLLHELSHTAGTQHHELAFASTLAAIFQRHVRRNDGEQFKLREYDVHQDSRPADEAMHFAWLVGEHFADDTRSVFELVPQFWRIQYRADRVGLAAAMPRPRRRWFFL